VPRRGRTAPARRLKVHGFEDIRRRHQEILDAVAELEAAVRRARAPSAGGGETLAVALDHFLDFGERTLEPHLRDEEQYVYPLLDRYLPRETGFAAAILREHDTARGLLVLLRQNRRRIDGEAEADVAVVVQDLALVLRDHIRKEDGVINPLLERLLETKLP
jgi:hemerythrin-like domain-containing protein